MLISYMLIWSHKPCKGLIRPYQDPGREKIYSWGVPPTLLQSKERGKTGIAALSPNMKMASLIRPWKK